MIDLEQQRAYFYRGETIVGLSVVSTGREGYDTPPGDFRITQKDPAHVSSIYGDYVDRNGQVVMENVDLTKDRRPRGAVFRGAPMPYFLRIHGGIGMHAGYLPGYPASHGCIRLPKQMAVHFFQNATVGTHVAIRQESPHDYAPDPLASDSYSPLTSIMERSVPFPAHRFPIPDSGGLGGDLPPRRARGFSPGLQPWEPPTRATSPERAPDQTYKKKARSSYLSKARNRSTFSWYALF